MAFTNFKETIWSTNVLKILPSLTVFDEICNKNYQGDAKMGKTVKIIGVGRPTLKTYVPGTSIDSAESPSDTSVELKVDQYKYINIGVDDIDQAQANVKILDAFSSQMAGVFAESFDKYVASLIGGVTNVIAATVTTPAHVKENIDKAKVALLEKNVPRTVSTYIVLSPKYFGMFKDALTVTLTNNVEEVKKGKFGDYDGSDIRVTTTLVTDVTGTHCAVLTQGAIAAANGIDKIEPYRPQDGFSDAMKALYCYGAKVIAPDEIVCLKLK